MDTKTPLLADHPGFDPEKVRVLLWSKSQNALHQESLADMLQANSEAFHADRQMDYVPLIMGDQAVVDEMARIVRPVVHARIEAADKLGL